MAKKRISKKYLAELEAEIKRRGVKLAYERLQFAGLMLASGLCWFRGNYFLFVDKRKSLNERVDLLESALDELDVLAAEGRLDRPFNGGGEEEQDHAS